MIETTPPSKVPAAIKSLLKDYRENSNITFEDIIDFHYKFEKIHPFQDGNGRVGRLIMFKECLKNNICPFIINDTMKDYYRRGLNEYNDEKGYLLETCRASQDEYKKFILTSRISNISYTHKILFIKIKIIAIIFKHIIII